MCTDDPASVFTLNFLSRKSDKNERQVYSELLAILLRPTQTPTAATQTDSRDATLGKLEKKLISEKTTRD